MSQQVENSPLFRETAVSAFAKRSYGRPIANMPKSWLYSTLLLFVFVALAIWLLVTSTYARKESVYGWLTPDQGLARISVPQTGKVESVSFLQGEFVQKGQTLFVLSQDKNLVTGSASSTELLQKLKKQKAEIAAQISIENKSSAADVSAAKKLLEQLVLEQEQLENQIFQQDERVSIQEEIYNKFKSLSEDESASYLEVQTQKERLSARKQTLASLKQRKVTLSREIINTQSIIDKRPLQNQRTISELQRRLIDLENNETELTTIGGYAIQAPITGRIATLDVQVGSTVYPKQLLISILPEDSELYAEVYIPSRAIGFIKKGQSVRLMYMAFPYQRFGAANGKLEEVSNTVLRAEEIPTTIGIKEPAYKARVKLEKQHMSGFGDNFPLRPGMALQAEIILEHRTFMQWLLEPLRARRTT